ncbi:hypothetical protein CHS0354_017428 [Potamilus streckersoni]|uniref:HTH OST-type domain-containing protein n=1 Tax=Potamilus streckersoni TaxID=2493646 RepID=A0AAE0SD32_9BIVA|nr:hypothetical protein CHS0354_017428 [Potamilus streckersoni]
MILYWLCWSEQLRGLSLGFHLQRDSAMSDKKQIKERQLALQDALHNDVISLLKEHPNGIRKNDIWNDVQNRKKRHASAAMCGVRKLSDLLNLWKEIEIIQIKEESIVRLKHVLDLNLDVPSLGDCTLSCPHQGQNTASSLEEPLTNTPYKAIPNVLRENVYSQLLSPPKSESLGANKPPGFVQESAIGVFIEQKQIDPSSSKRSNFPRQYDKKNVSSDDETASQDSNECEATFEGAQSLKASVSVLPQQSPPNPLKANASVLPQHSPLIPGNLWSTGLLRHIPSSTAQNVLRQTPGNYLPQHPAADASLRQQGTNSVVGQPVCKQIGQPHVSVPQNVQIFNLQDFPLLVTPNMPSQNQASASSAKTENQYLSINQEKQSAERETVSSAEIFWPPELPENLFRQKLTDILKDYPDGLKQSEFISIFKQRYNFDIAAEKFTLKSLSVLWSYLKNIVELNQDKKLKLCLNTNYSTITESLHGQPTMMNDALHFQIPQHPSASKRTKEDSDLNAGAILKSLRQVHPKMNMPVPGAKALQTEPLSTADLPVDRSAHSEKVSFSSIQVNPIEKKLFEEKETVCHYVYKPKKGYPKKDDIERVAKECMDLLADANEYVSPERIEKLLTQRYQVSRVNELGLRYLDQLKCVNEHNRMLSKVNAYVHAFVKSRSLCTLYELSECLREFVPNKEDFLHLKLGPIQRLPVVFEQFKFPTDQAIVPEITSIDIIEHFRNYLDKTQKWTSRLELEDFMNYLVGQYMAENAYYLGVRIRSMPLMLQVLKKARRDAANSRQEIYAKFQNDLVNEIKASFDKFRLSILRSSSDGDGEIQKHYLKLKPETAMEEILSKFEILVSFEQPTSRRERKQMRTINQVIPQFIQIMKEDTLAKLLFHIAVCISDTTLQEEARKFMTQLSEKEEARKMEVNQQHQKQPPRKDELSKQLKEYLEKCVSRGALTLSLLDRIEERLLEDFNFASFSDMKHGRFLQFLVSEGKQILEENGGITLGGSAASDGQSSYKHQQTDLLEFVKQANQAGVTQLDLLGVALCNQFHVKEVQQLGHGNISRLQAAADKPGKHQSRDFTVFYEAALVTNSGSVSQSTSQVGILGHQSREAALNCLHNCPLLEDLAEWSQWQLVFEPEHGRLKDFIQKHGGTKTLNFEGGRIATMDIFALETCPGHLIKLTNHASEELFAQALEQKNVLLTCGQLVSLVASKKGMDNLPTALLANHVKSTLMKLHAADPQYTTPGCLPTSAGSTSHYASYFVLQCLLKIPIRICQAVANKIFLEPLGQVVGSTKSKTLLMEISRSPLEQNRLQELGCLLGIAEWTRQLQYKCKFPESQIQTTDMEEFLHGEPTEESEEETDTEDSSSVILSDLSDDEPESQDESETKGSTIDPPQIQNTEASEVLSNEHEGQEGQSEGKTECKNSDDVAVIDTEIKEDLIMELIEGTDTVASPNKGTDETTDSMSDGTDTEKNQGVEEEELESLKEESEEEVTEEQDPCLTLINEIRRDEFGIGVELNEDGKRLMQVQQERLGRSLDRLSKDLYSKDTHFVLELVQNADDNNYPDEILSGENDACPSARFIINEKYVMVLNNECGFREKDIRALCDVGRSTKGKHKYGYIGQKGIGFKSVFRVTNCPEVHSNGYHICFDVHGGPMGYILPNWVTEDKWETEDGWVTKIVLPLKEEMQTQSRTLAARFNDIHPSLLLFLHRLREITIDNKIEGHVQTMRKCNLGDRVVEIKHSNGSDRWLVVKKVLDASKISSQVKSGTEVESTEIAVAFPLLPKGQRASAYVLPPKQPAFAFLPLRSYGFRFIIQGDFDVPSSREDVDKDSPWNQWLRSEIHNLFLDSLEVFKSHPGFNPIEALSAFLQFVPMEDEILDFFKPVATEILKKLKGKPCVPTEPDNKGVIMWKIPSQTVRVRDPLVHRVITPELLQKHLNLYYLHSDVAAMLNPTLTECLGIEMLTTEHLIQIGKTMIQNIEGTCRENDVLNISCWLACIYRSMDEFQYNESNEENIKLLKEMKMIPLSDGSLIALTERTVFFPVESARSKGNVRNDYQQILQQDLKNIHAGLMETTDNEINSQVRKLLHKLGVKEISPDEVINHHILPVLKSLEWKEKSRDTLIAYIIYIKEQTDLNPSLCNFGDLKEVAHLVTNHGVLNPIEHSIHFTPNYGNKVNLSKTFQGYDWILLDGCYLMNSSNQLDVHRCREFFIKLGVTDFLDVKKEYVQLDANTLSDSPWAQLKNMWPKSNEYVIQDYTCKELIALIQANKFPDGSVYQQQMRDLCERLDLEWDTKYSHYTVTQVCDSSGSRLQETETSISIALRTLNWLPARRTKLTPQQNGEVLESTDVLMMQPSCLYIRSPQVEKLVAHNVLYVDATLSPKSSFSKFLKLNHSLDMETVKKFLLEWSARPLVDEPAVFCTSLHHMKHVYSNLYLELSKKQVQDLFRENPVIFVPDRNADWSVQSNIIAGKMLSKSEIWMEDPTSLFDRYRSLLEEFYSEVCKKRTVSHYYNDKSDILELFDREMNIDHQPQAMEYAELLTLITQVSKPNDPKILPDIFNIYSVIGKSLSSVPFGQDTHTAEMVLKTKKTEMEKYLRKQKVLFSKCKEWVCPDDSPMIADNLEWEKMFQNKENIHFLQIEEKTIRHHAKDKRIKGKSDPQNKENVHKFLEICGVKKLSECVDMEDITDFLQECPQLQLYLHEIISTLQLYLASRYREVLNRHDRIKDVLKSSKFFKVAKLDVVYRLRNHPNVVEIRQEKCIIKPPVFYVHKDHVESIPEINKELVRVFSAGNPECSTALRSFLSELHNIIKGSTDDTVEDLLQRHDVNVEEDRISEEELWVVPAPVIQIMEVQQVQEEPDGNPETELTPDTSKKTAEGEPVLRAWPPVARDDGVKTQRTKEENAGSNIWPPPRAPDYMRSTKELPSHFKMAAPQPPEGPREKPDESKGSATANEKELVQRESWPTPRETDIYQQDSHPHSEQESDKDHSRRTARDAEHQTTGFNRQVAAQQKIEPTEGGNAQVQHRNQDQKEKHTEQEHKPVMDEGHLQKLEDNSVNGTCGVESRNQGQIFGATEAQSVNQGRVEGSCGNNNNNNTGESSPHRIQGEDTIASVEERRIFHTGSKSSPSPPRLPILGNPDWTHMAGEYTYDELPAIDNLPIPEMITTGEGHREVGIWGEHLIYNYLMKVKDMDGTIKKVEWINREGETGAPYDLEVYYQNNQVHYIEVKSTQSNNKEVFEISLPQIKFAEKQKEHFHIYRVFNAGNSQTVRLIHISNLDMRLEQKQVRLCMLI